MKWLIMRDEGWHEARVVPDPGRAIPAMPPPGWTYVADVEAPTIEDAGRVASRLLAQARGFTLTASGMVARVPN